MKINVLFASFEALPFYKTGGLADVVGALPQFLDHRYFTTKIVLPFLRPIREKVGQNVRKRAHLYVRNGILNEEADVYSLKEGKAEVFFIADQLYLDRDSAYGYGDDAARFAFFCAAVREMMVEMDYYPDILHTHDYHTAPLAALCQYSPLERLRRIKHIFTIHNLSFQGSYDKTVLFELLDLPAEDYANGKLRYNDSCNFLKLGVICADAVTTVSDSYAKEICTSQQGEGMDMILRWRQEDLYGIRNGIDTSFFDPSSPELPCPYDKKTYKKAKPFNKLSLQKELGLKKDASALLCAAVTRLSGQKGIDLILGGAERMLKKGAQLAVLGSGESRYEYALRLLEREYPGQVSFTCAYDEALAHRIYAGADLYLMPSLYEPCGLSQMIAMRYGTLPFVRETGGLKDTVEPFNEYTLSGTGFSFGPYDQRDFDRVFDYAWDQYTWHPENWEKLIENAMAYEVSFKEPARQYAALYRKVLKS